MIYWNTFQISEDFTVSLIEEAAEQVASYGVYESSIKLGLRNIETVLKVRSPKTEQEIEMVMAKEVNEEASINGAFNDFLIRRLM